MNFKILFDGNREFMRRIEKLEVDRGFEKNEAKESIRAKWCTYRHMEMPRADWSYLTN